MHLGAANPLIGGVTHQADTSRQCTLPHDKVFRLLGLLPQAISSKVTIDYKRDETTFVRVHRGNFHRK
jgi:hypothetical protein